MDYVRMWNYDDARQQIVGSIVSHCCICRDVAWTDFYGNYVCRDCCLFFVNSVFYTAEYWCVGNGNCQIDRKRKKRCHFCWLKRCFQSCLTPDHFGSNFINKLRLNRTAVRVRHPPPRESFRQIREFAKCLDWRNIEEEEFEKLPTMFPYLSFLSTEILLRYSLILIIRDSMFMHGNLMLRRCFMNPYKCKVRSLQTLAIEMMEMAEWIEEEKLSLNLMSIRMIIYPGNVYCGHPILDCLREKISRIERAVENFRNDLVIYAREILQRW